MKLATRPSSEKPGVDDWIIKRDFRRDLDQDIRREGYDYHWPNNTGDFASDPGGQAFPFLTTLISDITITSSGTTATVSLADGHAFVEDEVVLIAGADQSAYNGSFGIRNVDATSFQYTMLSDPTGGSATTSTIITARIDMPINLITQVKRPNGQTATVVGTATRLWRFFAMDNGAYAEDEYWEAVGSDAPYGDDNPGEWIQIGSGFSAHGHRWESLNINGYLVLNNGVDLMVTYRVEDLEVKPIYELREQGIGAVGTIGELAGILLLGDISEIKAEAFAELMSPVGDISSGTLTASQSTNTMTVPYDFFTSAMVGRWVFWSTSDIAQITAFTNSKQVTLSTSQTITNKTFTLRNKALQGGALWSGTSGTVGSMFAASFEVLASQTFFTAPMVGSIVRFSDGFSGTITAFTDSTHVTLDKAPTNFIGAEPFFVSDPVADYVVTSDSAAFDASMVGLSIIWDEGDTRKITGFIDTRHVTVDTDAPKTLGRFRIENAGAYAAFEDLNSINRIQYRIIWGLPNEPRRFGSGVGGNMIAGTNKITLDWPMKSFEAGQEIVIEGAGISGGNLTATITSVSALGSVLIVDQFASTTAHGGLVERSDTIDSIIGFQDLQNDSSAISRMLDLGKLMMIYTSTGIFVGSYTGDIAKPFDFSDELTVPKSMRLYYRWTLINIGGQFHMYASENSFYRFDLTSRVPQLIPEMDLVADIFAAQATLAQTDRIYACDNARTDEAWIMFPSVTQDKGICYDYKQGSVSTTSVATTAGATVEKPLVGNSIGITENWFVMAIEGVILVYGLTKEVNPVWNAKEIFWRRLTYPYSATKGSYESRVKSGAGAFGDEYQEKDLKSYVLHLASESPDCTIVLNIFGYRNPPETPVTRLSGYTITSPKTKNLVAAYWRAHYFQDELIVNGIDNPCRLAARTFDATLIASESHPRRP